MDIRGALKVPSPMCLSLTLSEQRKNFIGLNYVQIIGEYCELKKEHNKFKQNIRFLNHTVNYH